MSEQDHDEALLTVARSAAANAYCRYSNFPVGAAVQSDVGVFSGCNIENASYGLTVCAERVAIFNAIAAGAATISCLAVDCVSVGSDSTSAERMPCGACRQVMVEFMKPDATIFVGGVGKFALSDLLPTPFALS